MPALPEEPGLAHLQLPHQELPAEVSTLPFIQESFVLLCELIFEKEDYAEERQLFQLMMNAYNRYDPQQSDSDEEEEYSDSGYDSEEW